MNYKANTSLMKFILIILFSILSILTIIISSIGSARGYELNIYASYPPHFWVLLILNICLGIIFILTKKFQEKKIFIFFALISILISNLIFFLIPYFRGYPVLGGANADFFSHIGLIKEIQLSGNFNINNFYPITHILGYSFSEITSLRPTLILNFFPSLFWTLFPVFFYIMSKILTSSEKSSIYMIVLTLPLIFSQYYKSIHPSFFSFIFIPFFLFLYFKTLKKRMKFSTRFLLILVSITMVFFHPETTIIMIIFFLVIIFSFISYKLLENFIHFDIRYIDPSESVKQSINILLILLITFLIWFSSQGAGQHAIYTIFSTITKGSDFSIASEYSSTVSDVSLSLIQILKIAFLRYSVIVLYSLFTGLILLKTLFDIIRKKPIFYFDYLSILLFFQGIFIAGIALFNNFIVTNPIRVARFYLFITMIIIGYHFQKILSKINDIKSHRFNYRILHLIFISFLLFSVTICILNVHPSPIISEPGKHYTQMNFKGAEWIVENTNNSYHYAVDSGINVNRIYHFTYGITKGDNKYGKLTVASSQSHFGYNIENNTLIEVMDFNKTYVVNTENGRQGYKAFPENIWPSTTQYLPKDIKHLWSDTTVSNVYDNNEVNVYSTS